MLKVDASRPPDAARSREPRPNALPQSVFNARTFGSLLRCSVCQVVHGCIQGLATPNTRGLILDGLCPPSPFARPLSDARSDSGVTVCACTHYLVFKEPAADSP